MKKLLHERYQWHLIYKIFWTNSFCGHNYFNLLKISGIFLILANCFNFSWFFDGSSKSTFFRLQLDFVTPVWPKITFFDGYATSSFTLSQIVTSSLIIITLYLSDKFKHFSKITVSLSGYLILLTQPQWFITCCCFINGTRDPIPPFNNSLMKSTGQSHLLFLPVTCS
jgi:hypothetical protein